MRSAFWRGVTLLKESDSDASQCRGSMVASSGPSRYAEGFSEAPKNVSLLEPVIGRLMEKVARKVVLSASSNVTQDPPKGASLKWLSMARGNAQWLQKHELSRKREMEDFFHYLEGEMARVESLIRENEEQ
jgi:hypothetical protein